MRTDSRTVGSRLTGYGTLEEGRVRSAFVSLSPNPMTVFEAILLGVVQGFSMLVPVSSTSHLVLTQHFLIARDPAMPSPESPEMIFFDPVVHMGTPVSMAVVFRSSLTGYFRRRWAPEFSFFIAFPTILGGSLLMAREVHRAGGAGDVGLTAYLVGFATVVVVGVVALKLVLKLLYRARSRYLAWYVCLLALVVAVGAWSGAAEWLAPQVKPPPPTLRRGSHRRSTMQHRRAIMAYETTYIAPLLGILSLLVTGVGGIIFLSLKLGLKPLVATAGRVVFSTGTVQG